MYYFSLYLGSGVGEGGKKGKVKENGTEGWNRVTDFERLVYNNRLSKGLADRRRLERLKASHPNLYYCSNERSIGADRPPISDATLSLCPPPLSSSLPSPTFG